MNITPEGGDNKQNSSFETGSDYVPAQADYTKPPEVREREQIFGILSLVLGIVSLFFNCCCMLSGIPFGIASIVLAAVDKAKNDKMSGMSIAGMVCSIVSTVGVVILFGILFVFGMLSEL